MEQYKGSFSKGSKVLQGGCMYYGLYSIQEYFLVMDESNKNMKKKTNYNKGEREESNVN